MDQIRPGLRGGEATPVLSALTRMRWSVVTGPCTGRPPRFALLALIPRARPNRRQGAALEELVPRLVPRGEAVAAVELLLGAADDDRVADPRPVVDPRAVVQ